MNGDKELCTEWQRLLADIDRLPLQENAASANNDHDLAFGGWGNGPGQMYLPAGLHIDDDNQIFVVSQYSWRVNLYDYLGDRSP